MATLLRLLAPAILLLTAIPLILADGCGRPCGFKIAPCPTGMSCSQSDSACPLSRGENCPGNCVPHATGIMVTTPTITTPTLTTTTPTTPTFTRQHYEGCGGKRATPLNCPTGHVCIDDPYRGGCGMACDAPGICVMPTAACGGIAGRPCKDGRMCVDYPGDECDTRRGGRDCGGICV
jgi:hypothetical protein